MNTTHTCGHYELLRIPPALLNHKSSQPCSSAPLLLLVRVFSVTLVEHVEHKVRTTSWAIHGRWVQLGKYAFVTRVGLTDLHASKVLGANVLMIDSEASPGGAGPISLLSNYCSINYDNLSLAAQAH